MASGADIVVATSIPPRLSRTNDGVSVGDEYQRLCVESWLACGFKVLSVNPREEIEPLARRFPEIEFVPVDSDARAVTGRALPFIADLLRELAASSVPVVGIINSDIVFEPKSEWRDRLGREACSTLL